MNVRNLLSEPDRTWHGVEGASSADVQRLVTASPVPLPERLLALLQVSNGGEGPVALPPLVFVLDDVDSIILGIKDEETCESCHGFVFFGGNGGLERIALDVRGSSPPWPIVMLDPIAGPESAQRIAEDFERFLDAVGRENEDSL